jgi:hypothetical protein
MRSRFVFATLVAALWSAACSPATGPAPTSQLGPLQSGGLNEQALEGRLPGSADVPLGTGAVEVVNTGVPSPGADPGQQLGAGTQAFYNYPAPRNSFTYANSTGEASIGVNPHTNAAMFLMSLNTARVTFDDSTSPAPATWTNVSVPLVHRVTLDPILFTDPVTGRTFVNQLNGAHSVLAYTDDDGATWTHTEPVTVAPSFDHQSIGAGPYGASGIGRPLTDHPHAVYYCAQGVALSQCTRSDTGGLTWGPPLTMNNLSTCAGLHGDPTVGPDGTVYVPHKSCGGRQGVRLSRDDGTTFSFSPVPGTSSARSDPQVAVDAGGTVYFAASSSGKPVVATSTDAGETWSQPAVVEGPFDINNTEFAMIVAGDAGRAAMAFYGTSTPGNDQGELFDGAWAIYTAYTYDGGQTWETVQATPVDDPVQRGCIWMGGGTHPCRNLLDFQGMAMDAQGRVVIGYADGCLFPCTNANGTPSQSRASYGTIARQTSGKGLLAAYDQ